MDAPNYVQGLYTVAQRDAIFAKADKYPDASNGLQNQVPTIFPDGSIGWRQIPEGGDGTANANIAVIESTQYASKDYSVSDYLIFDGQLYRVVRPIAAGDQLNASSAVGPINISTTRVDRELFPMYGKGRQLLRNWLFCDDGEFPINQRGNTVYTGAGPTIDGWMLTGGTLELRALSGMLGLTAPENQYCDFYQIVDGSGKAPTGGIFSFSLMINGGLYSGHTNLGAAGIGNEVVVYEDNRLQLVLENLSSAKIKATIRMFAGKAANLIAAKLEMGYKSTLAIRDGYSTYLLDPLPEYGEELAKCQRYLHIIKAYDARNLMIGNANANDVGSVYWDMTIPIMVKTPSLTVDANKIGIGTSGFSLNPTTVSLYHYSAGHAVIGATGFSGLTVGQPYRIGLLSGGTMIFSAE